MASGRLKPCTLCAYVAVAVTVIVTLARNTEAQTYASGSVPSDLGGRRTPKAVTSTLPTTPSLISLEETDAVPGPGGATATGLNNYYLPFPTANSSRTRNRSSSSSSVFTQSQKQRTIIQDALTNDEITRFWKIDKDLKLNLSNSESGGNSDGAGLGLDEMVPSMQSQTILAPMYMHPKYAYDHSEHLQEQEQQHPADDRSIIHHAHRSKHILRLPVYTPLYRQQRIITHIPAHMAHYPPPKRMRQHFKQKKKRLFKGRRHKPPPPKHVHHHQAAMHHKAYAPAFVSYGPIMGHGHGHGHGHGFGYGGHGHSFPDFGAGGGGYDHHGPAIGPGPMPGVHSGEYSHSIQSPRYIPPASGPPQVIPPAAPPLPPFVGKVVGSYIPPGPAPAVAMTPGRPGAGVQGGGAYPPRPRPAAGGRRRPRPGSSPRPAPALYETPNSNDNHVDGPSAYDLPDKDFEYKPEIRYHWKNSKFRPKPRRPKPKPVYGPPEFEDEDEGGGVWDDHDYEDYDADDHPKERYDAVRPKSYASPKSKPRPPPLYDPPMRSAPAAPAPSMLYVPAAPHSLYGTPVKDPNGKSNPPMTFDFDFGHPMRNFGPPMSSYGQPHPIMGEQRPDRYAPKDEMYTYRDGGAPYSYSNAEHGNVNEVSNYQAPEQKQIQKAGTGRRRNGGGGSSGSSASRSPSPRRPFLPQAGRQGGNSAAQQGDSIDHTYYEKVEEQLSKKFEPPYKPFRPRRKQVQHGGGKDNYEYVPPRQQQQGASAENYSYDRGGGGGYSNQQTSKPQFDKPPPNFNTNYNSPGLYLDPKIVDWAPFTDNTVAGQDEDEQYRFKRNKKQTQKSSTSMKGSELGSPGKYSTLPHSFKHFTPDPDHVKYPKLTYDASTISKRVVKRRPSFNATDPSDDSSSSGGSVSQTVPPVRLPPFNPFKSATSNSTSPSVFSSRSLSPQLQQMMKEKSVGNFERQTENELIAMKTFLANSKQATHTPFPLFN